MRNDEKNRNIIIIVYIAFAFISFLVIYLGLTYNNSETVLDESIVSAGAFLMLILATMLQLHELNAQREDLKLTRKEMRTHSKEFNKANELTTETLNQAMFFELLRFKEEYSNKLISEESNDFSNYILGYFASIHHIICKDIFEELTEIEKEKIINDNAFRGKYLAYKQMTMGSKKSEREYMDEKVYDFIKSISQKNFYTNLLLKYNLIDDAIFEKLFEKAKIDVNLKWIGTNYEVADVKILTPFVKHRSILELLKENHFEDTEKLQMKNPNDTKTKEIANDETGEDSKDNNRTKLKVLYMSQLHVDEKLSYKILNEDLDIRDIYTDYFV